MKVEKATRPENKDGESDAASAPTEEIGRSELIVLMGVFSGTGMVLGLIVGWIIWHH